MKFARNCADGVLEARLLLEVRAGCKLEIEGCGKNWLMVGMPVYRYTHARRAAGPVPSVLLCRGLLKLPCVVVCVMVRKGP